MSDVRRCVLGVKCTPKDLRKTPVLSSHSPHLREGALRTWGKGVREPTCVEQGILAWRALNAAAKPARLELNLDGWAGTEVVDLLNGGEVFPIRGGRLALDLVWTHWVRILAVR
jgi:hypothetical protein